VPLNKLKGRLSDNIGLNWKTSFGQFEITKENIPWIMANAKESMYNNNRSYIYNKAFYEAFFNPVHTPDATIERFDLIRSWAAERGIYQTGNSHTQYVKLIEEAGELAQAILKQDKPEIQDAIGDMVVVLTNLAYQEGFEIEDCIDAAYTEIAARTGKMINGTFVKDAD
jgi:NTP pyrophosphatase (non-canonical NTP hydrolase)